MDTTRMQLGWYRKSTPQVVDWSLSDRAGYLRLNGSPYSLSTPACSTTWLRKQTHQEIVFETKLDFRPDSPNTEAAVVLWLNYSCFSSMGVRRSTGNDARRLIRLSLADGTQHEIPIQSMDSEVVLRVRCGTRYEFVFAEVGDDIREQMAGSVSNATMTRDPQVGAVFTGMMLGIYSYGELEPVLAEVDFAYAQYRAPDKEDRA